MAMLDLPQPPKALGLDPFYQKWVDVRGLPVVSSAKCSDKAVIEAAGIAGEMLKGIDPKAIAQMKRFKVRIAIMAATEQTTDIPEHSDLNRAFPETDWNKRARGLGATEARPAISGAEENLLELENDRYKGESIFIHEFAHAIFDLGIAKAMPKEDEELKSLFKQATEKKLWANTYAGSNPSEYWAEGVQSYFDANRTAKEPNGVHNHVGTREALKAYDPGLFRFIDRLFGKATWRWKLSP